jgi:hypothetical protein
LAGRCSICKSKKRAEIEKALVDGTSLRAIATQFRVTKDSVSRHQLKCVSTQLAKVTEEKGIALRERLLDEVESIHATTREILLEARGLADHRSALRAIAEARKNVALLARMTGKLQPEGEEREGMVTWEEFTVMLRSRRGVEA